MFGIGILLMLTLALCETFNMKKIAEDQSVKNFMTFVLAFLGFIISIIFFFLMPLFTGDEIKKDLIDKNMSLFEDWRFYIAISSEILGIWVARKNYEVNGNNITAINFSLFFSLVLVPLYSFLGNDFFGFEETLNINYESKTEFWIFISVMTFLTVLFFVDKVKGHINNIFLILLLPLILSNSMFLTGKLMQIYDPFFAYGAVVLSISIVFIFLSLLNKEYKNLNKKHIKLTVVLFGTWSLAIPANSIAMKILAVEFVTLLKRISQISAGLIMDKIVGNQNKLSLKDKIVIVLIFILGFSLYYLRG